jgi:hypothetical protein
MVPAGGDSALARGPGFPTHSGKPGGWGGTPTERECKPPRAEIVKMFSGCVQYGKASRLARVKSAHKRQRHKATRSTDVRARTVGKWAVHDPPRQCFSIVRAVTHCGRPLRFPQADWTVFDDSDEPYQETVITMQCDKPHCVYVPMHPLCAGNNAFRADGSAGPPTAPNFSTSDPPLLVL